MRSGSSDPFGANGVQGGRDQVARVIAALLPLDG